MFGRFTQEDTYRGDGLNLYAYCANNPVRYIDPTGFDKEAHKEGYDVDTSKILDAILVGAEPGRVTKGKTTQYVKHGLYEQASRDFDLLNPIRVKVIDTKFGSGKTEVLLDGRTITARPGSSDGRPTLEIRKSNGRGIEIRYGE